VKWHGFGFWGMWGRWGSDPAETTFSKRVAELGVITYGSPYPDDQSTLFVPRIDKIPEDEGVFLWGTSLGANDVAVVANLVKRRIDGAFGWQASIYGARGYPLNANVKFAHLIYSYNPIPFPGLGAYKWPPGTMSPASYHLTPHHLPHPGDGADQDLFLGEMRRIMEPRE
jgi:hypothetical protein